MSGHRCCLKGVGADQVMFITHPKSPTVCNVPCVVMSLTPCLCCINIWRSIWKQTCSEFCPRVKASAMDQWAAKAETPVGPALKRRQVGGEKEEVMMKAAAVLLKSNLKAAADVRALQSATFRTSVIPSSSAFVEKAKQAGQKYNEMVQAAGKQHEYGPPHVHVWAALVVEACNHATGGDKECIMHHVQSAASPTALLHDVVCCRVSAAYGGKTSKIQVSTTETLHEVTNALFRTFSILEGVEKHGVAPTGGLEREMQDLLDEVKSKWRATCIYRGRPCASGWGCSTPAVRHIWACAFNPSREGLRCSGRFWSCR